MPHSNFSNDMQNWLSRSQVKQQDIQEAAGKEAVTFRLPGLPTIKVRKMTNCKFDIQVLGRELTAEEQKTVINYLIKEGFICPKSATDELDEEDN